MKISKIVIILLLLIGVYLMLINFIESKWIYPESDKTFSLSMYNYIKNENCLDFGPINIIYYNDPKILSKQINAEINAPNAIWIESYIREGCDFNNATISVYIDKENLEKFYFLNENPLIQTNKTNFGFEIIIKDNSSINAYNLNLIIEIKKKFFNYYIFQSQPASAEEGGINLLAFPYRTGIFNGGYYADENSFSILQSVPYKNEPIKSGRSKRYDFENPQQNITLRFNPKSKLIFLIQKMLDALILGLIVIFIHELVMHSKWEAIINRKNIKRRLKWKFFTTFNLNRIKTNFIR